MLAKFAIIVVLILSTSGHLSAQQVSPTQLEIQKADDAYRVGTDIGAMYIAENTPRLRITLLLQECGARDLASALAIQLPNSIEYFFNATPLAILQMR